DVDADLGGHRGVVGAARREPSGGPGGPIRVLVSHPDRAPPSGAVGAARGPPAGGEWARPAAPRPPRWRSTGIGRACRPTRRPRPDRGPCRRPVEPDPPWIRWPVDALGAMVGRW